MKLPIMIFGMIMLAMPVIADDDTAQNLTARKTCAEIKIDMDALSAMENIDDVNAEKLKQFQVYYRANCLPKSIGRRTVARNIPVIVKNADTTTTTSDALSVYLANKKSNCDKLKSEIEKIETEKDDSKSDLLASMRGVYDMDCVEKNTTDAPASPEISEEEWAAQYDANLAAGLCGDGTKPNKYGCCTDEVFKDLGNLKFACCPKTGGDCFPPIK